MYSKCQVCILKLRIRSDQDIQLYCLSCPAFGNEYEDKILE